MFPRPPQIRTDLSNPFAYNTMKVRIPATIREVQQLNPDYPETIQQALDELRLAIEQDAPMPMIDPLAPDYESWAECYAAYAGQTWRNTHWFFSEIFFYRHLIQAVRWWETGRDPFAPKKNAELASSALWTLVDSALESREMPIHERLNALIHADLWGNRIDLSFAASMAHGGAGSHEDLLANDDQAVVHHLLNRQGTVHFIADNTGTELAMDLVLSDALLEHCADAVIFHLKMHPTFVSDATVPDMLTLLNALNAHHHSESTHQLGARLQQAVDQGRLRFAPNFFWNSSHLLWELPPYIQQVFANAALVIIKGDANYRRMVGDSLWDSTIPFAQVTDYFPAPLLALRTLKSDPIVGLSTGQATQLDAVDPQWHVNGRRGVLQFKA